MVVTSEALEFIEFAETVDTCLSVVVANTHQAEEDRVIWPALLLCIYLLARQHTSRDCEELLQRTEIVHTCQ